METFVISGSLYNLKPVEWDFNVEPLGLLLIWEGPKVGEKYCIGVDTADGVGEDRSAVQVNRVGSPIRPDELVCEWVGNVNGLELAPVVHAIAQLYSTDGNEPVVCIEMNRGDVVQCEMRIRYGWSNFYRYRHYDKVNGGWAVRVGWHTNAETRPRLLSCAVQHIKACHWKINSPWTIDEISNFEYNSEKMTMKASVGSRDDRVMSAMIALYCSKELYEANDYVSTLEGEEANVEKSKRNPQTTDVSAESLEVDEGMLYY